MRCVLPGPALLIALVIGAGAFVRPAAGEDRNDCVQVFDRKGRATGMVLGGKGAAEGKLDGPVGMTFDPRGRYSTLEGRTPPGPDDEKILVPLRLDEGEKADLIAFLESLTGQPLSPELLRRPLSPQKKGAPRREPPCERAD